MLHVIWIYLIYDCLDEIFNGWNIGKMTDKIQDRQRLANIITQWNQDHYDLFELSQPNEVKFVIFLVYLESVCSCVVVFRYGEAVGNE